MSCLDDEREMTWQTGGESIPRIRHSLGKVCAE